MKQTIRTSKWLSVIAPKTQETCTRETFTFNPEANAKEIEDDHEQDIFYRRPSLWSH